MYQVMRFLELATDLIESVLSNRFAQVGIVIGLGTVLLVWALSALFTRR